jgi:UDP-N-acetylmuramoylalanine--D-glutamate ligase
MKNYKDFFVGKKITVVGLGLLGKRIECIKFFSDCGAQVLVTDLKKKADLLPALKELKSYKNITYRLGEHRLEDFEHCDFVLKGQGTPLDSVYITHAQKKGIPIEMDESLFIKLAPQDIKVIGVTGTRGKTTTTMLIYHTLKKYRPHPLAPSPKERGNPRVFLGGNIKGTAVLPLLKTIKSGDTLVLELSSWQLQGFGDAKISPHISVFTNFMEDHLNYYKGSMDAYFFDKSHIVNYQQKGDVCVAGASVFAKIKKLKPKGTLIKAEVSSIPKNWKLLIPGEHNKENASCAYEALRAYGLKDRDIKKGFESFKGVNGRLSFVRNYKGISIYNDTTSTTPAALAVALQSFPDKHIVLIAGGTTKGISFGNLPKLISKYADEVVLLPGTGTDELCSLLQSGTYTQAKSLKDAVKQALVFATKGSIILFSPGFASFGLFKNEYDRGDQFEKIIKELK